MGSMDGVAEVETDTEYEEWLPSVLNEWNIFQAGDKNAKQYTAFLRFVFKAYCSALSWYMEGFSTQGQ
eukprot:3462913-Prymnesium_polylepis.1